MLSWAINSTKLDTGYKLNKLRAMDKKLLMQKAYNWIAEQDENGAIISDGDIDIASEFIAEFIQNLIDNCVLAETSEREQANEILPLVSDTVCPYGHKYRRHWCTDCAHFDKCKIE